MINLNLKISFRGKGCIDTNTEWLVLAADYESSFICIVLHCLCFLSSAGIAFTNSMSGTSCILRFPVCSHAYDGTDVAQIPWSCKDDILSSCPRLCVANGLQLPRTIRTNLEPRVHRESHQRAIHSSPIQWELTSVTGDSSLPRTPKPTYLQPTNFCHHLKTTWSLNAAWRWFCLGNTLPPGHQIKTYN